MEKRIIVCLIFFLCLSANTSFGGEKKVLKMDDLKIQVQESDLDHIEQKRSAGRTPQSITEEDQIIRERHQKLQEFSERMIELRSK